VINSRVKGSLTAWRTARSLVMPVTCANTPSTMTALRGAKGFSALVDLFDHPKRRSPRL
jgi:hypothetical protein